MSCNITIDNGTIKIEANNGKPSILFANAKTFTGNQEQASDIWAVSQTESFLDNALITETDKNGEPILKDVVYFIERENIKEPLSEQELTQLKVNLADTRFENSDQLKEELRDAFFPEPTRNSLNNLDIYTSYERENILRDLELQNSIQEFIIKLSNTEETVVNDAFLNKDFIVSDGLTPNQFGKTQIKNPYIVEQDAIQKLGGLKEEEFNVAIQDPELEFLKGKYDFFSKFKRIRQKVYENGILRDKPQTDTKNLLDKVLQEDVNGSLRDTVSKLLVVHPFVYDNSPQEVQTMLSTINKKAAKLGLDLKNLGTFYDNKSQEEMKDFLVSVNNLFNLGNIDEFASVYDDFFGVDISPKVIVQNIQGNKSMYNVITKDSAYTLFQNEGLLPLGNNLYQRTDALRQDLDSLYDIASQRLNTPLEELKRRIQSEVKLIDLSKVEQESIDSEVLQKMVIYKELLSGKLDNEIELSTYEENLVIDVKEVSDEYVSEFYIANMNSELFKITENGIEPISLDPITLQAIRVEIENNSKLKNYFNAKINSEITFPNEGEYVDSDEQNIRDYYTNYPQALPIFQEDYQRMEDGKIGAQSQEPFLRISDGIYQRSDVNIYEKMIPNTGEYKVYGLNIAPDILPSYTAIPQTNPELNVTNTYNKAQEEKINEELACK